MSACAHSEQSAASFSRVAEGLSIRFAMCCFSVEVLFSVPKKNHKRANVRNLLRRRTKEAYRLNKSLLHDCGKLATVDMALIYSSKEVVDYKTIENAVRKILATVAEDL